MYAILGTLAGPGRTQEQSRAAGKDKLDIIVAILSDSFLSVLTDSFLSVLTDSSFCQFPSPFDRPCESGDSTHRGGPPSASEESVLLNKLFGRKKKGLAGNDDGKELTIEDLITLERYEEALEELKQRARLYPKDLHSHLKIAEVYVSLKNVTKALDSYLFVADSMADDGFFDKAIALLSKAAKLAPGDDQLPKRINRYRAMKKLEHRRTFAIEGLMMNSSTQVASAANSALEVEMMWNKIAKSHLVAQLDGEQLKKLFSVMSLERYKEGHVLVEAGGNLPLIHLIVEGVIEAGATINGKYFDLRTFSTGDLIGDSALLEHSVWPATYKIVEDAKVFTLDRSGMQTTMVGHPDPRAFISVLRQQHHDRDVLASMQKLQLG